MSLICVKLSSRCEVYLTVDEINAMLIKNPEIFKAGISRGKGIRRGRRFD
jgi:hypothetical protein